MFFVIQFALFLNIFYQKKFAFYFLYLAIFLFCALRFGQGPDYFSYEHIFDNISKNFSVEFFNPVNAYQDLEFGFRLINSLVKKLNGDYQTTIILFSLIMTYTVWKSGREFSSNEYIFAFLYFSMFFLPWPYSGVRQGLTLIIGSYFINKVVARQINPLSFIFIVLFLSTIHLSSIALILFFLIGYFSFPRNQFLLFLTMMLACSPLVNMFFGELLNGTTLGDRISFYAIQEFEINLKFIARFVIFFCSLVLYYCFFPQLNSFQKSLFQIFLTSFVVYASFRSVEIVAAQISIYGFYFILFTCPIIYRLSMGRRLRSIIFCTLFVLCFLWAYKDYVFMVDASARNLVFFDTFDQFLSV